MHKFYFFLAGLFLLAFTNSVDGQSIDGYALYNSLNSTNTYLIDKEENIAHSWNCNDACNYAVHLLPTGNLIRGVVNNNNQINGAAVGGRIQEVDANCNIIWDFQYSSSTVVQHHDFAVLPNGNVIITAWEVIDNADLVAMGYTGNTDRYATHFVELEPDGAGSATIVWEWHIIDHFVQDVDPNKPNYGVIADNPHRLDINLLTGGGGGGPGGGQDWFHVNGIDYNPELDQIVFSSRFLSEIFIIDHSTSTFEASLGAGGNSGKGGDFLYRWGNPANYETAGAQIIPDAVHDARWIKGDGPNNGFIQVFNNFGSGNNSTIDAIETPVDGFNYTKVPGQQYQPASYSWRHNCLDNANGQSSSDRMPDGNTFVNLSGSYMYEVDDQGNLIWQYAANSAKAFRYTCDYPGIAALLNTDCNCDANGSAFLDDCNECVGGNTGLAPCVAIEDVRLEKLEIYPNPAKEMVQIEGLDKLSDYQINITDISGKIIETRANPKSIDFSSYQSGVYYLSILIEGVPSGTRKLSVIK